MELEHSFSIPVPVEKAWPVLLDIRQIAPCMPGAAVDSVDGDDFTGTVKVKLGPINLTYKGQAKFVEKDEANHKAVIDARGRDSRGNGTAAAKITATLTGNGDSTDCKVITDLNITGKPAQFGRGVMVDVGNKLIGQFADCLSGKLAADKAGTGSDDAANTAASSGSDAKPAGSSGSDAKPAGAASGVAASGAAAPAGQGLGSSEKTAAATTAAGDEDKTPTGSIPTASAQQADADKQKSETEKSALPGFAGSDDAAKPVADAPREAAQDEADRAAAASSYGVESPATGEVAPHDPEPIDLIHLAGGTVAKKAAPLAIGALAAGLIAAYVLKKKR